MEKQVLELRKRIQRARRRIGGRRGFGADVRGAAVALSAAWRDAGGSQRELSRRLGLSNETLASWCREGGRVLAVEVVDDAADPSADAVRVELPGGVVVTGLSIEAIAELSRRLR
jgi:hypothetical protein